MFIALFLSRIKMAANQFRLSQPRQRLTWLGMSVLWALLAVWIVWGLVNELEQAQTVVERKHALEALFLYLGMLMILSSAPQTFGAMFQSQDLYWLMGAPIKPINITGIKIIDGLLAGARIFLPFSLPAYAATAWAMHLPLWGWFGAVLIWLGFVLLCGLVTQLLLIMISQLLGANRVQAVLVVLNFIVALILTIGLAANPERTLSRIPLTNLWAPEFFATGWCADALMHLEKGAWLDSFGAAGMLWLACLFTGALIAVGGHQVYKSIRYAEAAMTTHKTFRASFKAPPNRKASYLIGISNKDFSNYIRDHQLLSQLLAPIFMLLLPIVFGFKYKDQWELVQWIAMSMVGMTAYMQTSVISLQSVGLDSRGYWIAKTAPITPLQYLFGKWFFCVRFVGLVILAVTALVWFMFRLDTVATVRLFGCLVLGIASLSGLGVGLSALFPKFVYDNPGQRVGVWLLLWGFILFMAYLCLIGLMIGLTYVAVSRDALPVWTWIVTFSNVVLVSVVFGLVPLVLGARRLANYEWEH